MARIRTVKPEFWTSEQIMECSPNARLLFIGMWNFADDAGRLTCSPRTLKAQIYPSDDLTSDDVLGMLLELAHHGLLGFYEIDNKALIQITGWKHQRIDKPQPAKFPPPSGALSKTVPGMILDGSYGIVSEGRGAEPSSDLTAGCDKIPDEDEPAQRELIPSSTALPPPKKKQRMPPDWALSETDRVYAKERGLVEARIDVEAEKFRNYHLSRGSTMLSWSRAWMTWVLNAIDFDRKRGGGGQTISRQAAMAVGFESKRGGDFE